MPELPPFLRLDAGDITLVFDLRGGDAALVYLGASLPRSEDLLTLGTATARGGHENQAERPARRSVLPQSGWGGEATPALVCLRGGRECATHFRLMEATASGWSLTLRWVDERNGLAVDSRWRVAGSGVVCVANTVTNCGESPLTLVRLAALALPLPPALQNLTRFSGRWAAEMQQHTVPLWRGEIGANSRGGRPGFSGGQWALLSAADATEGTGLVLGAHLAWSGDHELLVERDADGEARLLMAAQLETGEVELAAGEAWESPTAVFHLGGEGHAGLRRAFHRHVLAEVLPAVATRTPRKVHLNTWEAVYFDQSLAGLQDLAAAAAALGVERFVLDDGWFKGRRNDRSSLGDWTPDATVFPEGLGPLIDRVQSLGMDFGLWVEPEMLSPDSDLARAHPEWCLAIPGHPRPTQRHQWVLDLTRTAAAEHVFRSLEALLRPGGIAYLKWDHNRELFPRAGRAHAQARAHLALLARLRRAFPQLEIETCASGGGRVDLGLLQHCSRFWASDNNDPVERLGINEGWFQFLPPRIAGNHVGPSPNPITGRQTAMLFRARVALFGHMGVEADPRRMSEADRLILARHIACYRQWRDRLHAGDWWRLQGLLPGMHGWLVVDGAVALALVAQTRYAADHEVPPIRFIGLRQDKCYRVTLPEPWPTPAERYLADAARWREGLALSGAALAAAGLSLPLIHPETAWLLKFEELP